MFDKEGHPRTGRAGKEEARRGTARGMNTLGREENVRKRRIRCV